jgi:quinol monooxygenase YgiN
MFARVARIEGKPDKVDDVIRYFREQVLTTAKQIKGFKQGFMMVNHQTGNIIVMVHWENQQAIQDSNALASRVIPQMGKIAGATQEPMKEIYEVAVSEVPAVVGMK